MNGPIIATADCETDPFDNGAAVAPFTFGFYDGQQYRDFWGADCVRRFIDFIDSIDVPTIVYFHNGGRFDFFFFYKYFEGAIKIVNKRILQAYRGMVEFRDSFAIYPEALASFKKDEIDHKEYMHRDRRERPAYKAKIRDYQRSDCVYLHEIVTTFRSLFGNKLTIGGAAIKELEKVHRFEHGTEAFDRRYRPFYFGGRTQCFEAGELPGAWKVYDINSQYAYAMRNILHPIGLQADESRSINATTNFVVLEALNYGALPMRMDDGSLRFDIERGIFHATRHEVEAGEDTGTLKPRRIIKAIDFEKQGTFADFVDKFFELKVKAEKAGNALYRSNYKRVSNSCYGKFAQNPENYCDYLVHQTGEPFPPEPWVPSSGYGSTTIWEKPSKIRTYYNVATAASITGVARAILLRGLANATRPIYCDTDSIICAALEGVDMHDTDIGAWKCEATANLAYIAGKKMYALLDTKRTVLPPGKKAIDPDVRCVKKAHKGARLTAREIRAVALGETVDYVSPVPVFQWNKPPRKIQRSIRRTVKASAFRR